MTQEIKVLLEKICNHEIFEDDSYYFVGGTALSYYLNHRISYDIDIALTKKLPVSDIKAFAYGIGARVIPDNNAMQFRINTGEDIQNYHMKFMLEGVKLEFSFFRHPIQQEIIKQAQSQHYVNDSKLKVLDLKSIVKLKIFALFNRKKTRDLFDAYIILEKDLFSLDELETLYSYVQKDNLAIRDYIEAFTSEDDSDDNSLDFLKEQAHYKTFGKKNQSKRYEISKVLFLEQYDKKRREKLAQIEKECLRTKKI